MENLRPTLNKLIVVINRSKLHLKTYDEKFCSRSRAAGYSFLSTEYQYCMKQIGIQN